MRLTRVVMITAGLLAVAFSYILPARAATLVDQNDSNNIAVGLCNTVGTLCGQSFQQDHTNIAGAGVYISGAPYIVTDPSTLTISIYSAYGSSPSGLIAQGSISVSTAGWADIYWTSATVALATTYYMVVTSSPDLVLSWDPEATYPNGNLLLGGSTDFPSYDMVFRTYYDDGSIAAPLPAAFPLFASGLGALGLLGWRRKRKNAAAIGV